MDVGCIGLGKMGRLVANLTMLWPELADPYARIGAAAAAGFTAVELLFPQTLDRHRLAATLRERGVEMVLFDTHPGDWDADERGLLCVPGRETEFLDSVRDAIDLAHALEVQKLNALAGISSDGAQHERAWDTAIQNLNAAADLLRGSDITVLVEAINRVDMPGYLLDTIGTAADLVRAVSRPSIKLLFDAYHVAMSGDNVLTAMQTHLPAIAHVQIADAPGRHEPGTGTQPILPLLHELHRLGYSGDVALEYRPIETTEAGLAWAQPFLTRGGRNRTDGGE